MNRAIAIVFAILGISWANVTVTIFPTTATALTWTLHYTKVVFNETTDLLVVKRATCALVGMKAELVRKQDTITINMGKIITKDLTIFPSAQYATTLLVNPDDLLYLTNVRPLVWCTDIEETTYSVVQLTIPPMTVKRIPIYYTITETYIIPTVTTTLVSPDLPVLTSTCVTKVVRKVITKYTTLTLNDTQAILRPITTTGFVVSEKTHIPFGLIMWNVTRKIEVTVPTTITLYHSLINMGMGIALLGSEVPSTIVPLMIASIIAVTLLLAALTAKWYRY